MRRPRLSVQIIEVRGLQRAGHDLLLYGRCPKSRDPFEAIDEAELLTDSGVVDHPAVAYPYDEAQRLDRFERPRREVRQYPVT